MDSLTDMQKFAAFAHPVGEIVQFDVPTSPATLWGFGTWESLAEGRVLIGAGTADSGTVYTAGQTGGEEKHVLTNEEMPIHWHIPRVDWSETGGTLNTVSIDNKPVVAAMGVTGQLGIDREDGKTGYTGGDQPHNIMQPYYVCYMWRRVA